MYAKQSVQNFIDDQVVSSYRVNAADDICSTLSRHKMTKGIKISKEMTKTLIQSSSLYSYNRNAVYPLIRFWSTYQCVKLESHSSRFRVS